jgi:hypothetical protein
VDGVVEHRLGTGCRGDDAQGDDRRRRRRHRPSKATSAGEISFPRDGHVDGVVEHRLGTDYRWTPPRAATGHRPALTTPTRCEPIPFTWAENERASGKEMSLFVGGL